MGMACNPHTCLILGYRFLRLRFPAASDSDSRIYQNFLIPIRIPIPTNQALIPNSRIKFNFRNQFQLWEKCAVYLFRATIIAKKQFKGFNKKTSGRPHIVALVGDVNLIHVGRTRAGHGQVLLR